MSEGPSDAGSISVGIVPSAEGFVERLRAAVLPGAEQVGRELADLLLQPMVDDAAPKAREALEAIRAVIDTDRLSTTIHVNVDSGEAETKLAAVDVEAKALSDALGGSGGAGGSGLAGAFSSASAGASGLGTSLGPLLTAGIALSPLLAPVGGSLITGIVGLASALTAAGSGAVGFGAVFLQNVTAANNATQQLAAAQKSVDNATTLASRTKAIEEQKRLIDSLSPSTLALGSALSGLDSEWKAFAAAFAPQTLQLVNTVVSGLGQVIPEIAPLVKAGADALNVVAQQFVAALTSPAGKQFFDFLATQAGPTLVIFADTFLHLGSAVASLFEAFTPLTSALILGIDHFSASLADGAAKLSTSNGFAAFIAYMQKNGPLLLSTLEGVGKEIIQIVIDLAPLAPPMLDFINDLLKIADAVLTHVQPELLWFGNWLAAHPALIKALADAALALAGVFAPLADGFGKIKQAVGTDVAFIANLLADLVSGLHTGFSEILRGANDAFGWIPGLKGPLKDAQADFDAFAQQAVDDLHAIGDAAADMGETIAASIGGKALHDAINGIPLTAAQSQIQKLALNPWSLLSTAHVPGQTPKAGASAAALPLTAGAASGPSYQDTLNALFALQGVNLGQSFLQGIQTGVSPIDTLLTSLSKDLGAKAQPFADAFKSIFDSALQFGETAASQLKVNLSNLPGIGTQTNVTALPNGQLVSTQLSPLLGQLQLLSGTNSKFTSDIAGLTKLGVNRDLIDQFVQAGPSSDSQVASLLGSSKADIAQINALDTSINSNANVFGVQQAQLKSLDEIAADLKELIAAVEAQASQLGGVLDKTSGKAIVKAATTGPRGPFGAAR